ncbi:hypothetical protein [Streptomyces sp. 891-h]|uniref:hypothetical protein n=1 Tax=unclassified Streptomyces TaxID=2593676 RepID=UPI001FAA77A9|nr:hypothetical protein [Streptomyces sp. 891-h]UNZ15711.1 hypothetical protein HC362_19325 [Streptomyces sp. 891-h]
MKHTIIAPVAEFTGVVAGVHFADGKAETDNENAVAYFLRQGYTVKPGDSAPAGKPDDGTKTTGRTRSKPKEE